MNLSFSPGDKTNSFGNHFLVGLSGTELAESDKVILGKLKPAGVLLLGRNFVQDAPYPKWISTLNKLLEDVHNYAERDKMFISLDHEGGRVMRTPEPITRFPSPSKYAKRAAEVAKAMAVELKSLGVNLSWAPLADIHSNPKNPIIGERAFGTTPNSVIAPAIAFAQTLAEEGILACAKHFPGHGDTSTDSHLELPTVNLNMEQLEQRELAPFKALVDINIPFIMTAHIMFPKLDSLYPATLSSKILDEILRKKFGYKGVVISDDIDMKAVSDAFKESDTIARAMNAGCDMFIVARNPDPHSDRPIRLAQEIAKSLRTRSLNEDTLYASHSRIVEILRAKTNRTSVQTLSDDVLQAHAQLRRDIEA
jgi:beta-N-acetylhexosaminidase